MKKFIVASAIILSTAMSATSFAATTVKEKNTLGTADRTGEKNTLGTADRTGEKNTLGTADRF
ncbi:hypothetical protein [Mucilaginibacter panaciglaebae]|uniref:Uncharacterized protein n=1 Tax=Mucilaginibacter panaciglaebae TaxID=502331 RepID=A0ABP7WF27_9SPHI